MAQKTAPKKPAPKKREYIKAAAVKGQKGRLLSHEAHMQRRGIATEIDQLLASFEGPEEAALAEVAKDIVTFYPGLTTAEAKRVYKLYINATEEDMEAGKYPTEAKGEGRGRAKKASALEATLKGFITMKEEKFFSIPHFSKAAMEYSYAPGMVNPQKAHVRLVIVSFLSSLLQEMAAAEAAKKKKKAKKQVILQ